MKLHMKRALALLVALLLALPTFALADEYDAPQDAFIETEDALGDIESPGEAPDDTFDYDEPDETVPEDDLPLADDAPLEDAIPAEDDAPSEDATPAEEAATTEESPAEGDAVPVEQVDEVPEEDAPAELAPVEADVLPLGFAIEPGEGSHYIYRDEAESEALMDAYVQGLMDESLGKSSGAPLYSAASHLDGMNAMVYAVAKEELKRIANGELSSSIIEITLSQVESGLDLGPWTAKDLGVDSLVGSDNYITEEAMDKAWAKNPYNPSAVIDALHADCPAYTYWASGYDSFTSHFYIDWEYVNGELALTYDRSESIYLRLGVQELYATNYQGIKTYTVDTSKTSAARNAIAYAQTIVDREKDTVSVYDRLKAYKQAICDLVVYNKEAANNSGTIKDRGAWAIVYVFDQDKSTNVVCEGYAKAFKYLFDLSGFDPAEYECILPTGDMRSLSDNDGGLHMWNLVRMEDGKTYIVDVTNCDNGTIGYPNQLFMVPYSYTINDGATYVVSCEGDDIAYTYEEDPTLAVFSKEELTVSGTPYVPNVPRQITIAGGIDHGEVSADVSTAKPGDTVTLTVVPEPGYALDSLSVSTASGSVSVDADYRFTMPAAAVSVTATFSIIPAETPDIYAQSSSLSLVYGSTAGVELTVSVSDLPDHQLTYQWYSAEDDAAIDGATSDSYTLPANLKAGTHAFYCVVTAKRPDNGQSASATSANAEVTVERKSVTITGLAAADKVYDGAADAEITGNASVSGLVSGDDVSVEPGTAAFDSPDVGADKPVTFSGFALSGADASNYALTGQPAAAASIAKLAITVAAKPQTVQVGSAISDGTDWVALTAGSLADGQSLSDVTLTASGTDEATSSGTITPSAAVITDGANDVSANYDITYIPGTLTVLLNKPELTEPAAASGLVYSGEAQPLATPGSVEGGTLEYALGDSPVNAPADGWSDDVPAEANAGTYYVWYRVAGDEGYGDIAPMSLKAEIAPASIKGAEITLSEYEFTYDRTEKRVEIIGVTLNGAALTDADYEVDDGSFTAATEPETYTVMIRGIGNYTDGAATQWQIAKAVADKESLSDDMKPAAAATSAASATAQPLVAAPAELPEGYTGMRYSTDDGETWSEDVPAAASAGTYTVRVLYVGDDLHADFEGDPVKVTISAPAQAASKPATVSAPSTPAATPAPEAPSIHVIYALKKASKTTIFAAPGTFAQLDWGGVAAKKFKSSKKKVATVNGAGLITIKAAGKTKISFKVGKKTRTVTLTVKDPTIPSFIALNLAGTVPAQVGVPQTLTVTLSEGTNSGIKWKTSNKKVATVSNGVVTFKKAGKVTITATATRGKKKAKVKFVVTK